MIAEKEYRKMKVERRAIKEALRLKEEEARALEKQLGKKKAREEAERKYQQRLGKISYLNFPAFFFGKVSIGNIIQIFEVLNFFAILFSVQNETKRARKMVHERFAILNLPLNLV